AARARVDLHHPVRPGGAPADGRVLAGPPARLPHRRPARLTSDPGHSTRRARLDLLTMMSGPPDPLTALPLDSPRGWPRRRGAATLVSRRAGASQGSR